MKQVENRVLNTGAESLPWERAGWTGVRQQGEPGCDSRSLVSMEGHSANRGVSHRWPPRPREGVTSGIWKSDQQPL